MLINRLRQVKLSAEKAGGVKSGYAEALPVPGHLDSAEQKSLPKRREAVI